MPTWESVIKSVVGEPPKGTKDPDRSAITGPPWLISSGDWEAPIWELNATAFTPGWNGNPGTWSDQSIGRFGMNKEVMNAWRAMRSYGVETFFTLEQALLGNGHPTFDPRTLQVAADTVGDWWSSLRQLSVLFDLASDSFGAVDGPWAGNASNVVRSVLRNVGAGFRDLGDQLDTVGGARVQVPGLTDGSGAQLTRTSGVADRFLEVKAAMDTFIRSYGTAWSTWDAATPIGNGVIVSANPATILARRFDERLPPFLTRTATGFRADTTLSAAELVAGLRTYFTQLEQDARRDWLAGIKVFDDAMGTAVTHLQTALTQATSVISEIRRPRNLEDLSGAEGGGNTNGNLDLQGLFDELGDGLDELGGGLDEIGGGLDELGGGIGDLGGGIGDLGGGLENLGGGLGDLGAGLEFAPPPTSDLGAGLDVTPPGFETSGTGTVPGLDVGGGLTNFVPPTYPGVRVSDDASGFTFIPPAGLGIAGAGGAGGVLVGGTPATSTTRVPSGSVVGGGSAAVRSLQGAQAGGGVPIYPPMAGGMGGGAGERRQERERVTWLAEDATVWGTDPPAGPGVIGRQGPDGRHGRRPDEQRSVDTDTPTRAKEERMRDQ